MGSGLSLEPQRDMRGSVQMEPEARWALPTHGEGRRCLSHGAWGPDGTQSTQHTQGLSRQRTPSHRGGLGGQAAFSARRATLGCLATSLCT